MAGKAQMLVVAAALGLVLLVAPVLLLAPGARAQQPSADRQVAYDSPTGAPHAAGELIVTLEPGASREATKRLQDSVGGETLEEIPELDSVVISIPEFESGEARALRDETLEEVRSSLEESPYIRSADYNYLRTPSYEPNDARFGSQSYLEGAGLTEAWDVTRGAGADVAVVDTGITATHPDLSGKVSAQRNFAPADAMAGEGTSDVVGHGSHVAGIAAANTDNRRGVAGACPGCGLINAKVAGPFGAYDSDIASGVRWSVESGAEVVNVSMGGPEPSAVLRDAVDYAWNNGALVVAAAGNEGAAEQIYPAAYPRVLGVAATDDNERRSAFSNSGPHVDVAAPGEDIVSTVPGGYEAKSGTSMSSPLVAGIAGMMSSQGMTNYQIQSRLQSTAVPVGTPDENPVYGSGIVDAASALGASEGETGEAETYTVREGDTVYSIAERFGRTPKKLAEWNGLDGSYSIYPGDRLRVG